MGLDIDRNLYSDYAEKLYSIEEELHAQPVTEEVREQIIHELDEVHEKLNDTAVQVNRFAQSFLEELRQKAVFLYGEVDDFFYKHEVHVIEQETETLAETLQQKDMARISNVINSLKAHINELLESFSPALQERRVLVLAKLRLEQAEALMRGQLMPEFDISEWTFLESEAIIEEIAEYLGNNDKGALRLLLNRLTPGQKRIVMGYFDSKDLLSHLLHDIEGAADQEIFVKG